MPTLYELVMAGQGITDLEAATTFARDVTRHDGTPLDAREREAITGAYVLFINERDPADTAAFYAGHGHDTEPVTLTALAGAMKDWSVELVLPTWLAAVVCGPRP